MMRTDEVVRSAVAISRELAYSFVVRDSELATLFLRPWGARGQGIWVRRVLPGPEISPPWQDEYERRRNQGGV
jgi:hypothetical protein